MCRGVSQSVTSSRPERNKHPHTNDGFAFGGPPVGGGGAPSAAATPTRPARRSPPGSRRRRGVTPVPRTDLRPGMAFADSARVSRGYHWPVRATSPPAADGA